MIWMNIIGKEVEIIDSSNSLLLGRRGIVLDETRNIIKIVDKKEIMVPKDTVNLLVDGKIVYGKEIRFRPIDRISRR
ncbi:MAG: ribonuclease P protein subunit [Thermoplasmata archaeon]